MPSIVYQLTLFSYQFCTVEIIIPLTDEETEK